MRPPLATRRNPLIAACAAGLILLLSACFWAGTRSNFPAALAAIASQPWGLVTLLDLYVGLAVVAVVIYSAEDSKPVALVWIVLLVALGNVATLAWMIRRALLSSARGGLSLK